MENTIKIKIYGPQGSGKTRMVEFLTGVLLRDGYVFYHNPHKKVTPIKGPHEEDFRHLFKVGEVKGESLEVLMCSTNATEGEAYRAEADRLLTELKKAKQGKNTAEKQLADEVVCRKHYQDRVLGLSEELEKTNRLMDRLKSDNRRLEKVLGESEVWGQKVRGDIAAALNQKDEKGGTPKAKKYRLKPSAEGYMPPYHPGQVYSIDWDPQQDGIAPAHMLIARYPKDWIPIKIEI